MISTLVFYPFLLQLCAVVCLVMLGRLVRNARGCPNADYIFYCCYHHVSVWSPVMLVLTFNVALMWLTYTYYLNLIKSVYPYFVSQFFVVIHLVIHLQYYSYVSVCIWDPNGAPPLWSQFCIWDSNGAPPLWSQFCIWDSNGAPPLWSQILYCWWEY